MVNTSPRVNTNSNTFPNRYEQAFPPQINELPLENIQAEEAILGGIILDPSALTRVIDILDPEAFYIHSHRLLYKACLELNKQGESTDLRSLTIFLHDHQLLESIGGQCRLAQLVDPIVNTASIDYHARTVMDKYRRRLLKQFANEVNRGAHATDIPLEEVAKGLSNKLIEIDAYRKPGESYKKTQSLIRREQLTRDIEEAEQIDDPYEKKLAIKKLMKQWDIRSEKEFLDLHAKWLESTHKKRSYSLDEYLQLHGNKSTNWLLDGWIPEQAITVLHSLGGAGKTTLVNSIARSLISGQDWSGYQVSKPAKILWVQTDQGPTVTNLLLDRQGFFSLPSEIKERQRLLDDWYIEEYAVLERELSQHHYDLVIIDSLSSVSAQLIYRENDQEFARPLARLRNIANKHKTSFLILHHSNMAGGMRGTTAIYNAADQVFKLERVAHGTETQGNLTIEKSRFREDKKVYRVQFDPDDHTWFALGQVTGTGETEEIEDGVNPTLQLIRDFLRSNEGTGFEFQELVERLGINDNYCRKLLGQGSRDGLLNSFKGTRKHPVYYFGQLANPDPSDPPDPPDPFVEDLAETHTPKAVEPPQNSSDPPDPQNLINVENKTQKVEDHEDLRIRGSETSPQEGKRPFEIGDIVSTSNPYSVQSDWRGIIKEHRVRDGENQWLVYWPERKGNPGCDTEWYPTADLKIAIEDFEQEEEALYENYCTPEPDPESLKKGDRVRLKDGKKFNPGTVTRERPEYETAVIVNVSMVDSLGYGVSCIGGKLAQSWYKAEELEKISDISPIIERIEEEAPKPEPEKPKRYEFKPGDRIAHNSKEDHPKATVIDVHRHEIDIRLDDGTTQLKQNPYSYHRIASEKNPFVATSTDDKLFVKLLESASKEDLQTALFEIPEGHHRKRRWVERQLQKAIGTD